MATDPDAVHGRAWRRLLGWLEVTQDLALLGLVLGLYVLMAWQLTAMWRHLRLGIDVRAVLTDILYVLILVELFRVVMHYLRERHVAVGTMVEIAIISVLRVTTAPMSVSTANPARMSSTSRRRRCAGLMVAPGARTGPWMGRVAGPGW